MSKHMGSNFDDFLEEEEILDECKFESAKRVFVWQLLEEMKKQKLTKEEVAKRMHTSRASLGRLLDPAQPSTLKSLMAAATAVGKQVRLTLM